MHNRRSQFGMCSVSGCIFVAGGYNDEGNLDKCEVYNAESCKWVETSSMNTKRCSFALIYFQDEIWALGGFSNESSQDAIETYNIADNRWTTVDTKLLSKRCGHSAVVHNKKFFVIGGVDQGDFDENRELSSVEVYSSVTNQFSFVSPMSRARVNFGCSVFNNKLVVFGGSVSATGITDSVEVYDIENDVWSEGPSLPLPLTGFGYANTD